MCSWTIDSTDCLQNIAAMPESLIKGLHSSVWEDQPTRESHTSLLQTANSLFDRQDSLRRRVEQSIQQPVGEPSVTGDDGSFNTFADQQQSLLQEVEGIIQHSEISLTITDDDGKSRTFRELLDTSQAAMKMAADKLRAPSRSEGLELDSILGSQMAATESVSQLLSGIKRPDWAGRTGLLAVAVIVLWQLVARGYWKLIPAPLLAVVAATALVQFLDVPVLYVNVPDHLWTGIQLPTLAALKDMSISSILFSGMAVAVIASAGCYFVLRRLIKCIIHRELGTDKELAAQGAGNILCGILGALPMTGVIVRKRGQRAGAGERGCQPSRTVLGYCCSPGH